MKTSHGIDTPFEYEIAIMCHEIDHKHFFCMILILILKTSFWDMVIDWIPTKLVLCSFEESKKYTETSSKGWSMSMLQNCGNGVAIIILINCVYVV